MNAHSLSHLQNHVLLHDLAVIVARDRATTSEMLAYLAEVDARKLYRPRGYSSMFLYCVGELRLSEDAAAKRIQAARAARQFPAIFAAVADGRLHLSAVVQLAPHLTLENAAELLAAAAHKTKFEIENLLAQRFPKPDVMTMVRPIAPAGAEELMLAAARACESEAQHAPGHVVLGFHMTSPAGVGPCEPQHAPGHVGSSAPRAKVAPLSPGRYALQVTIDQEAHDLLRYAQALLGHAVPSGDISEVLKRALHALVHGLEKQRFAATSRSRPRRGSAPKGRHVPAAVRREVWQRDQGQCTFVSENGRRCESRKCLEFDHKDPVARGGQATTEGMRLRCRAHNQYAAECAFGAGFMQRKREEARREAIKRREARDAREHEDARAREMAREREAVKAREREAATARAQEVIPWLRELGFRTDEARRAAALCETIPDASLEERVRHAIKSLAPASARRSGSPATASQ